MALQERSLLLQHLYQLQQNNHSADNHWKYLLWWKGRESVNDSLRTYIIYDYPYLPSAGVDIVKDIGYVKVGVINDKRSNSY